MKMRSRVKKSKEKTSSIELLVLKELKQILVLEMAVIARK